jgi:hypothetical protein
MLLPFHKEAVGNPAKHPQDEDAFVALHAAAIVVVGNIQPLVKATLNAPALAVEFQPTGRIEPLRWRAGDQSHFLIFAALGLTQQPGPLGGKRKPHVLRSNGRRANDAIFSTPLVVLLSASLSARGLIRGGNPLGERILFFEGLPTAWVGSFYW